MWIGQRSEAESAARLRAFAAAIGCSRGFLVVWTLAWIGIAVAYVGAVRPEFVAKVDVTLEPRLVANDGPEDLRHYHQFALDSDQADTELRLLRSERLLRSVFDELRLADLPELADHRDGFWSIASQGLHRFAPRATSYDAATAAFFTYMSRVRCLRLGLSYVFEISYRAGDPNVAARVANAIADAYVADRLKASRARLERAGGPYRTDRVQALSAQIAEAQAAAERGAPTRDDLLLADARVLGAATPPLAKSYPRTGPTLLFAIGFAAVSGVLLILMAGVPAARVAPARRAALSGPRISQSS